MCVLPSVCVYACMPCIELLQVQTQYIRAECLAASLERQLKQAVQFVQNYVPENDREKSGGGGGGGSNSSSSGRNIHTLGSQSSTSSAPSRQELQTVCTINYSFLPDLEPSSLLQQAIRQPALYASSSSALSNALSPSNTSSSSSSQTNSGWTAGGRPMGLQLTRGGGGGGGGSVRSSASASASVSMSEDDGDDGSARQSRTPNSNANASQSQSQHGGQRASGDQDSLDRLLNSALKSNLY